jgi:hypothetical protein
MTRPMLILPTLLPALNGGTAHAMRRSLIPHIFPRYARQRVMMLPC